MSKPSPCFLFSVPILSQFFQKGKPYFTLGLGLMVNMALRAQKKRLKRDVKKYKFYETYVNISNIRY